MSVTTKELRDFGLIFGALLVLLFGFLFPWFFNKAFPFWPWWVFAVTGSLALVYPLSLKPLYEIWMLFGAVMGWLNTRFILGIIFYLVFTPFGIVMRIFGKDPLSIKLDSKATTYRVINNSHEIDNMENPY